MIAKPGAAALLLVLVSLSLSACGGGTVPQGGPEAASPTVDAATRSTPVVVGRPSRVFVMAGIDDACRPLPEPEITITSPPAQGDISFVRGQDTTIAATAKGTCIGSAAKGTGVYYTARSGATGRDRFAISARLSTGETASRVFEVTIAE